MVYEVTPNPTSKVIAKGGIEIGDDVYFGENTNIEIEGKLKIGKHSKFLHGCTIRGNNCMIGEHFFTMAHRGQTIDIGGGGIKYNSKANIYIGDRCVIHNSHINIADEVKIGNDVGISPNTEIITHGFWDSSFKGYPRKIDSIEIGNNVSVGWGTLILMGSKIPNKSVIGAKSIVNKKLNESGVYVGQPVRFISNIMEPNKQQKQHMMLEMLSGFDELLKRNGVLDIKLSYEDDTIKLNNFHINIDNNTYYGEETYITDAFRDYIRRYGIKIYTPRGFKTDFKGI